MDRSPEPRISVAAAAETYGCSPRTIRRHIAEGRLRAYRVGPRLIRIDPRDLDQLAHPLSVRPAGGVTR